MYDFIFKQHHCHSNRFSTALLAISMLTGLVLSVMYMLETCTEACSDAAVYSIFGFDFSLFGILFFTAALLMLCFRKRYYQIHLALLLMMFASAGAELHFIWLQKFEIGTWCPICLSIAAAVYCGCAILSYETLRSGNMKLKLKRLILMLVAMLIGVTTSIAGVARQADASPDLYLGKKKSSTVVYFVSDWFCPACKALEPRIEEIYNSINKKVKVGFIDFPIHRESNNYTPYNLQFLMFEKAKYPKLRAALAKVAKQTKKPTDAQVQAAITPLGVKLRQLDNADLLYGMQHNMTVYRGYDVNATPSIVVVNEKNKKQKNLVGGGQITIQAVKDAIAYVTAP